MASSSTHDYRQFSENLYATTAAPPPTPSAQPNSLSSSDAGDVLSRLLHRLTPTLSLPTRRSLPIKNKTNSPPVISLSSETLSDDLLAASTQLGFFQLTHHSVPSQLAHSAESESLSLLNLSKEEKQQQFPQDWPLGFDCKLDDDSDDEDGVNDSLCLDLAYSTESSELSLDSLREFTGEMEKLGMEIVEALSCAVGFRNPIGEVPDRVCSLMWISDEAASEDREATTGRLYPYVIGLEYQIRSQRKYSILADSGWVTTLPRVDSILVTLGDIAQVWSNGKTKKVRGRPIPSYVDEDGVGQCVSMSLLITLPTESIICPTLLNPSTINLVSDDCEGDDKVKNESARGAKFDSFPMEDYAWRVYHERLHLKDPLDRYRL